MKGSQILRRPETVSANDTGPDAVPDLSRIEVPAVVVIAEDAITPADVCQVVVDGLPNATAETVPGMGHFPTVTRPDTLVEVISARFG
jgi:pimeloyl-ACP methyl ester carboxylesterase